MLINYIIYQHSNNILDILLPNARKVNFTLGWDDYDDTIQNTIFVCNIFPSHHIIVSSSLYYHIQRVYICVYSSVGGNSETGGRLKPTSNKSIG